jgi:ABC-2 type transport system permease protein
MFRMFRSTWITLRRPGMLWGTYGIVAALTATITAVIFLNASSVTPADTRGPGAGVTLQSLTLGSGLLQGLTSSVMLLGLISLCVAAAQLAVGYSNGSLRNLLIRQPKRLRLLAGQWAAAVSFTLGAVVLAAVVAAGAGVVLAGVKGIDTTAWFTATALGDSARSLGEVLLAVGGFATLGAALGSVLRSPVAAISVGAAWVMAIESILAATISGADRWLPGQLLDAIARGGTSTVTLATATTTSLVYLLIAAVGTGALLRRRDVTA